MVAVASLASGVIGTVLEQILITAPYRAIGMIIPDVTVQEQHSDTITITRHPVEQGANVADHAYVEPARLTLRVGASDSANSPEHNIDVYQNLVLLQKSRKPCVIYTGKRVYLNMLLDSVDTETDERTAYSSVFVVRCSEVIIVQTTSTTLPSPSNQANPQDTAAPVNNGTQQTVPPPASSDSILKQYFGP